MDMSRLMINTIQDKLKTAVQNHQNLVARMKTDPLNTEIQERIHCLQAEITELSEKQKLLVGGLQKELLGKQSTNSFHLSNERSLQNEVSDRNATAIKPTLPTLAPLTHGLVVGPTDLSLKSSLSPISHVLTNGALVENASNSVAISGEFTAVNSASVIGAVSMMSTAPIVSQQLSSSSGIVFASSSSQVAISSVMDDKCVAYVSDIGNCSVVFATVSSNVSTGVASNVSTRLSAEVSTQSTVPVSLCPKTVSALTKIDCALSTVSIDTTTTSSGLELCAAVDSKNVLSSSIRIPKLASPKLIMQSANGAVKSCVNDNHISRRTSDSDFILRVVAEKKNLADDERMKLDFMASLDLVTPETLKELQSRRSERKRRSTIDPQFYYDSYERKGDVRDAKSHVISCDTCGQPCYLNSTDTGQDPEVASSWSCQDCQLLRKEGEKKNSAALMFIQAYLARKTAKEEERDKVLVEHQRLESEKDHLDSRVKQLSKVLMQQMEERNELLEVHKIAQESLNSLRKFVDMFR